MGVPLLNGIVGERVPLLIIIAGLLRNLRWLLEALSSTLSRPPNYPLIYPKDPLLRTIRALLRGTWGVLVHPKPLMVVSFLCAVKLWPLFGVP